MDWGRTLLSIISFPTSLLPKHTFTAGRPLASVDSHLFGINVEIGAVVSWLFFH